MAVINIAQFRGVQTIGGSIVSALQLPAISAQNLTFSATTQSAALDADCTLVRLLSDADCHISIGTNPTATTSGVKIKAGIPETFAIRAGSATVKIAVVAA